MVVVVVTGAVHCSLTTSLDDLTSGGGGDAGPDVATGPRDDGGGPSDGGGSTTDARTDGGGGSTVDSGPADGGATRFCLPSTTTASFCEDFDDPSGAWSPAWSPVVSSGATLRIDPRVSLSAPGSLATTTDGSGKLASLLHLPLPLSGRRVHSVSVAYDVRVDTYGSYGELSYISFSNKSGRSHSHYVRVYPQQSNQTWVFTSESYLADGGVAGQDVALAATPATGSWVHLTVQLDLAGGRVSVTMGATSASMLLDATLFAPGDASFEIGLGFVPGDMAIWSLHHDNVTVTWQ
jgi:hypothetical protein